MLFLPLLALLGSAQDPLPKSERPPMTLQERVRTVAAIGAELEHGKGILPLRARALSSALTSLEQTSPVELLKVAVLLQDKRERITLSAYRWQEESEFERADYLYGAFVLVAALLVKHEAGSALDARVIEVYVGDFFTSDPLVKGQNSIELLPVKRRSAPSLMGYSHLWNVFTTRFLEANPVNKALESGLVTSPHSYLTKVPTATYGRIEVALGWASFVCGLQ